MTDNQQAAREEEYLSAWTDVQFSTWRDRLRIMWWVLLGHEFRVHLPAGKIKFYDRPAPPRQTQERSGD